MEDIENILFLLLGMWLFVTRRRQALFEQRLQAARKNTAEKYREIREILRSWDETDNRASQDKARQKRRRRRVSLS
jgi:hypothetical protein